MSLLVAISILVFIDVFFLLMGDAKLALLLVTADSGAIGFFKLASISNLHKFSKVSTAVGI